MANIHPTAIVGDSVTVPEGCEIGPYSVIEDGVTLGPDCRIGPHAVLRRGTVLETGVEIHAGAVLGGEPQDLGFDPAVPSGVIVGAGTRIRELVTISRSSVEGGMTRIGARSFLMAACHVGHDCVLGEQVILANAVLLAGHVHVGNHAFLGGAAAIHQFCHIGESVIVGGHAAITLDLPPFTMVADRNRLVGLNLVGLRRRGFSREVIADIKRCYSTVYANGSNPKAAAASAASSNEFSASAQGRSFLQFFSESRRGVARPTNIRE